MHRFLPEERQVVLGEVGDVGRSGGRLDVLGRQPVVVDVGLEGDRSEGVVVPVAGQDALLFAVGGAFGGSAGGVGAGGADPSFGVAVLRKVTSRPVVLPAFDHVGQDWSPSDVSEMSAIVAGIRRRVAKVRGNSKVALTWDNTSHRLTVEPAAGG
jgi:hypothetical protein